MTKTLIYTLGLLASCAFQAAAQTFTDCNPLNSTCPADLALGVKNYTVSFGSTLETSIWNQTNGALQHDGTTAQFTISKKSDGPTVKTNFYFFFGVAEVIMKAAPGQGIVSSIVLLSDDLDEVDWEMIGGNNTHVETNFFGKGNATLYDRAIWYPISNPIQNYHNYTIVWTQEKLEWIVDGQVIRTLGFADYHNGIQYPQTPMQLSLGNWVGGDSSLPKGTVDWAGGLADFSKGPFTMDVKSVRVSDYSSGKQYTYGDHSGTWQSIKSVAGNSTIADTVNAGPAPTVADRWKGLSKGAQIGIIAGVGAVLLAAIVTFTICCCKQRRAGRRERALADAEWDKNTAELMAYKSRINNPGAMPGFGHGGYRPVIH